MVQSHKIARIDFFVSHFVVGRFLPFSLLCKYCTVRHIGLLTFNKRRAQRPNMFNVCFEFVQPEYINLWSNVKCNVYSFDYFGFGGSPFFMIKKGSFQSGMRLGSTFFLVSSSNP